LNHKNIGGSDGIYPPIYPWRRHDRCPRDPVAAWLATAPKKGINLPDTGPRRQALTAKDRGDLDVVVRHADMVALSFVQRPADGEEAIAELAARSASQLRILLQIETARRFSHLARPPLAAVRHPLAAVRAASTRALKSPMPRWPAAPNA
jgi:hypothetical protein